MKILSLKSYDFGAPGADHRFVSALDPLDYQFQMRKTKLESRYVMSSRVRACRNFGGHRCIFELFLRSFYAFCALFTLFALFLRSFYTVFTLFVCCSILFLCAKNDELWRRLRFPPACSAEERRVIEKAVTKVRVSIENAEIVRRIAPESG